MSKFMLSLLLFSAMYCRIPQLLQCSAIIIAELSRRKPNKLINQPSGALTTVDQNHVFDKMGMIVCAVLRMLLGESKGGA